MCFNLGRLLILRRVSPSTPDTPPDSHTSHERVDGPGYNTPESMQNSPPVPRMARRAYRGRMPPEKQQARARMAGLA